MASWRRGGRPGPRVWHHGGGGVGQALECGIMEEGGDGVGEGVGQALECGIMEDEGMG